MDVGTDKVKDVALAAGLRDDEYMANSTVPSYSIGTSSPSAIRMAGAYSTFATSGQQNEPFSVKEVKYKGNVIYRHQKKSKRAFDPAIADNVSDVLKNVVENGTGRPARLPGRDVAGKTGTTDGNKSAWFVGYTPQVSTAISMFRLDDDENSKNREFLEMFGTGGEKKIHGASFPASIWHDYMAEAMKKKDVVRFPEPQPLGETLYGGGAASPTPTPSPTPSATPPPSRPRRRRPTPPRRHPHRRTPATRSTGSATMPTVAPTRAPMAVRTVGTPPERPRAVTGEALREAPTPVRPRARRTAPTGRTGTGTGLCGAAEANRPISRPAEDRAHEGRPQESRS